MKNERINKNEINNLYDNIRILIEESRNRVYKTVNTEMVNLYWNIGKMIVEKQGGDKYAKYGDLLIEEISKRLTEYFGKGFSKRSIERMRKFYLCFPIAASIMPQLSWTHYLELIKIKEKDKRNFYMQECINSNWTVQELQRQRNTLLYERLLLSKDKNEILKLSKEGQRINEPKDVIKDPFVLEFLDLKENTNYLESDLEKNILEHLKEFLLELGKGFTFVGNQARITIDTEHFYPDLIFYNRLLKCFVIIDLKIGKVTHHSIMTKTEYIKEEH